MPTCNRFPVSRKATLKAFVKLECCFLNRIKAQIFFLCSQINIQQPIKAGGYVLGKKKKCLMSEEHRTALHYCPRSSSHSSDCWGWHHCHRIRRIPGTTSASLSCICSVCTNTHTHTHDITHSLCSYLKQRGQGQRRLNVWAETWQDVSKTRPETNKTTPRWSIFGKSCSG